MSAARNFKYRKPIALAASLLAISASLLLLNKEFHFVREPFGSYYGFENQQRLEEEQNLKALRLAELELQVFDQVGLSSWFGEDYLESRARHYKKHHNFAAAKILYLKIIHVIENTKPVALEKLAANLSELGAVYAELGLVDKATTKLVQAMKIRESICKPNSPLLQDSYADVADVYEAQGHNLESDFYREKIGLPIGVERWPNRENAPLKHCVPDMLYQEAESLRSKGRFSEAEKIYKRLVAVEFDIYGGCCKRVPGVLREYLLLLKAAKRTNEAHVLESLLNSDRGLSKADLAAYMVDPANENDFVIHPILQSKAGHNLGDPHLHDDVFRQLNGCVSPYSLMLSTEREYFEVAETEAAEQFAVRVKDLSKRQVKSMVGQPVFAGGTVDCWSISRVGEDIWLYRLGYLQIPVRLIFRDDKCINSAVCSSAEDREFAEWRAAEIAKFSVGKSTDLIVEKFGVPSGDMNLVDRTLPSSASNRYGSIGYITGLSTAVDLKIRHGICTDASIGMIAH